MSTIKFISFFKRGTCAVLAALVVLGSIVLPENALADDTGLTTAKVVLRKSADKDSKALQTIPKGEEVDLLSLSGSWYKVRYGNFTGYIMKQYVKGSISSSASSSSSKSSSVSSKIKALGSAPGIMRVGDENSDVKKLQQALDILGYYDGKIDGKYGTGTAKAVREYQEDKGLNADGYAGKYTVKSIFGSCNSRTLTTQPDPETSKKTSASSGSSSSSSSSSQKSKYPTVSSISAIGSAPGKCELGDSGSDVVKLQQALECLGYFNGAIDGKYGAETQAAVKRFQSKRGMKADGIAGSSTIRIIFGEKAVSSSGSSSSSSSSSTTTPTTYKTEVLDWYKDNVSSVIPKKARFTVKDCLTGKTFEMIRWSGGDHMDAEPATADDAATVKAIYGGSYSWRRRAILIKYNGHVYAASMNGMPHGDNTIANDFEGHLCIHFKNSKTHGSDKIDPDHQNAVDKASKYTW
ncbi:MAG: peptidoglycan-binding protein [Clostridia bacterium]|nr:peptidoglycan-binding protein [Clostridia bacterium]